MASAGADGGAAPRAGFSFRPCIDLHGGKVKQIVGSTLRDGTDDGVVTNFVSEKRPAEFAEMYKEKGLPGGHVIMLGPGNREAALEAVAAFPGGLQVGGGVTPDNCKELLDAGASHVIVTSYVFRDGAVDMERLEALKAAAGGAGRVVLDLSCRRRPSMPPADEEEESDYFVVTDRWQTFTNVRISRATLASLAPHCAELLVHGVDVEGKQAGIEEPLVAALGRWAAIPVTYAGGVRSLDDVTRVHDLGGGNVDVSIGSALDVFGGALPMDEAAAHARKLASR